MRFDPASEDKGVIGEPRYCMVCGKEIEKIMTTSWKRYSEIKTCSRTCQGKLNNVEYIEWKHKHEDDSKGEKHDSSLFGKLYRYHLDKKDRNTNI